MQQLPSEAAVSSSEDSTEAVTPEVQKDTLRHIRIAKSFKGTCEQPDGSNSGGPIDRFLAYVGLDPGYAWCAAYISYCNGKAGVVKPSIRDARSRKWITRNSFKLSKAKALEKRVYGMVGVHRHTRFTGHASYMLKWQDNYDAVNTIAGNVSNCVKERVYSTVRTSWDAPVKVTPVRYE